MENITEQSIPLETHPFSPFLPKNAKVLIMGTFPPQRKRWAMEFYYPNRTNDFWQIMGLIFKDDRYALYDRMNKEFNLPAIKNLLIEKGIAMSDTGYRIRRLKGNASDKFLDIVEAAHLDLLLSQLPECKAIATTGEKAAEVIADLTSSPAPKIGEYVVTNTGLEVWRMPSTSRAYPLPIEKKAIPYSNLFNHLGLL